MNANVPGFCLRVHTCKKTMPPPAKGWFPDNVGNHIATPLTIIYIMRFQKMSVSMLTPGEVGNWIYFPYIIMEKKYELCFVLVTERGIKS